MALRTPSAGSARTTISELTARELDLPAEATDNRRVRAVLAFLRAREQAPN